MNTQLLGLIRTQKIAGQIAIRRDHRSQDDKKQESKINKSKFEVIDKVETQSISKIAKELKSEQVKDIMQCMQAHSIRRMTKINDIAG